MLLSAYALLDAQVRVQPNLVYFADGQAKTQDLQLTNTQPHKAYVTVKVYRVVPQKKGDAKRVLVKNPVKAGLIIAPKQLIIPGNQGRAVRLVNIKPNSTKERSFVLIVEPNVKIKKQKQSDEIKVGIHLNIAYGVRVILEPKNPRPEMTVKREGQQLIFNNVGNISQVLSHVEQCPKKDVPKAERDKVCFHSNAKRIYAGHQYTVKLPYQTPVSYTLAHDNETAEYTK